MIPRRSTAIDHSSPLVFTPKDYKQSSWGDDYKGFITLHGVSVGTSRVSLLDDTWQPFRAEKVSGQDVPGCVGAKRYEVLKAIK